MVKLNPYPWLAGLIVLMALYAGHRGIVTYEVKEAVTISETKIKKEYQDKILLASSQARQKEQEMEKTAKAEKKVKDDQIKSITNQRDVALNSLRNRPYRPTPDSPKGASDRISCTGTQLYREDAEFLVREASRADQVMLERNYYYKQYEKIREQINEYSNSH
jgi:uncharacterized FlgJ-related protein